MAGVGVIILIVLMVSLFSPVFNKDDRTSKSYFNSFETTLNTAKSGGVDDFYMLDTRGVTSFYLVYFGGVSTFKNFAYLGNGKNAICICSSKKDITMCKYCKNLELPVNYIRLGIPQTIPWAIGEGTDIEITKKGSYYEFKAK